MTWLLRIKESLASRISLWVVLYVVVILTATASLGNHYLLKVFREIQADGLIHFVDVRRMALFLAVLFIVTLVVLTNLLRRAIHRLVAPLTAFTKAVDEVAQGNLQAQLPDIR